MQTLTRVRAIAWTTNRIEDLTRVCQDEAILAVLPTSGPYTQETARHFITRTVPEYQTAGGANLAIVDDEEALAGCVSISQTSTGTGRVGYWIAATHRGRGIAQQAIELAEEWAKPRGYHTLELTIPECNAASRRVAEKSGFAVTEHLGTHRFKNGEHLPTLRYERRVN